MIQPSDNYISNLGIMLDYIDDCWNIYNKNFITEHRIERRVNEPMFLEYTFDLGGKFTIGRVFYREHGAYLYYIVDEDDNIIKDNSVIISIIADIEKIGPVLA